MGHAIRTGVDLVYISDDEEFDRIGRIAALLRFRADQNTAREQPASQINIQGTAAVPCSGAVLYRLVAHPGALARPCWLSAVLGEGKAARLAFAFERQLLPKIRQPGASQSSPPAAQDGRVLEPGTRVSNESPLLIIMLQCFVCYLLTLKVWQYLLSPVVSID